MRVARKLGELIVIPPEIDAQEAFEECSTAHSLLPPRQKWFQREKISAQLSDPLATTP